MPYYVYILANSSNKILYLGRTENLPQRIYQHKNKLAKGFSEKYNVDKLVYYEVLDNKDFAAEREWKLKKWKRQWKDDLINSINPNWEDLYPKLEL